LYEEKLCPKISVIASFGELGARGGEEGRPCLLCDEPYGYD